MRMLAVGRFRRTNKSKALRLYRKLYKTLRTIDKRYAARRK